MSRKTEYEWKGVSNPPFMIEAIENENYEYLTFLTTYIIPLICIDLSDLRYVIVLGILLIIIGSIFVQMDLYYGNPTLALMGYKLYKVKLKNFDHEVTVISKSRLSTNMSIRWIKIDDYVWVAKENK